MRLLGGGEGAHSHGRREGIWHTSEVTGHSMFA
jgi:hypothetical protein